MSTEDAKVVLVERKGAAGVITLSRPERLNALDTGLLKALGEAVESLSSDRGVRAIVITGGRNFSAGADLNEMKGLDRAGAEAFSRLGHSVFSSIESSPKPFIAAVAGFALGGGCELALSCDIRIASRNARVGQPEVNLGLVPGFGGTLRLPRAVGAAKARELILTGRVLNAAEALSIGLLNTVVEGGEEEILSMAIEEAGNFAKKGAVAVKSAKALLNGKGPSKEDIEEEIKAFARLFETKDAREGINALLEKRTAKFTGE